MVFSVIIIVLILLTILGVIMYNSQGNQIFPSIYPPCPDYYSINSSGLCTGSTNVWDFTKDSVSVPNYTGNPLCSQMNFSGVPFTNAGIGKTSGLCAKKTWASTCNVTWDGITNNSSICYN